MSTLLDDHTADDTIALTTAGAAHLDSARKWGMAIGIFGLVIAGLMAVGGVAATVAMSMAPDSGIMPFPVWTLGLIYVVLAVVYALPSILLIQFCVKSGRAVRQYSSNELTGAMSKLKQMFITIVIMTIAMILFYFLFIIIVAAGAASTVDALGG